MDRRLSLAAPQIGFAAALVAIVVQPGGPAAEGRPEEGPWQTA